MATSKKITRLFISTGYYHNLILATLIEQISLPNVTYEDYLILSTVGQDPKRNLQMLNLLECNFTNMYFIKVMKDKETIKILKEKFQNIIFDEIYVDPMVSSIKCFKNNSNKNTKYYGVDEGTLSYMPLYHNNKDSGITKYLLYPQLYFNKTRVISLNREILTKNLNKISMNNNKKYNENSIIFMAGADALNAENIKTIVHYFNIFTKKGYTIYIKDHPRAKDVLKRIIIKCEQPKKLIPISEDVFLAEQIIPIIKPKMILGFKSTAIIAGYYLFNIPTFRVYKNFRIIKYRHNSIEKLLYCLPHLDDFLKQNKYNAKEFCDNYSFFYFNVFQDLLTEEIWYLPIKLNIYFKLFFKATIIKSFKFFINIIYYLIRYKYFS